MIEQKFAKNGRFRFQETWIFPKEISEFVLDTMKQLRTPEKSYCHVFCGKSQIGGLRIDIDESVKPDVVADCLSLPDKLGFESQKNVIADYPWQIGYYQRRYFSYALRDICKPGGYLLLNAPWNPWVEGLELVTVWKVMQNFNSYRDLVDWWVFRKMTPEELQRKKKTRPVKRYRVVVDDLDLEEVDIVKEHLARLDSLDFADVIRSERYEVRK